MGEIEAVEDEALALILALDPLPGLTVEESRKVLAPYVAMARRHLAVEIDDECAEWAERDASSLAAKAYTHAGQIARQLGGADDE